LIPIPISLVRDDLSRVLRMAEKEDLIITRHGVPAGILIGFEDPEAWWEELLLRDPRFRARVARRVVACARVAGSASSSCERSMAWSHRQNRRH
jgi:prevent-host-death family protein